MQAEVEKIVEPEIEKVIEPTVEPEVVEVKPPRVRKFNTHQCFVTIKKEVEGKQLERLPFSGETYQRMEDGSLRNVRKLLKDT